MSIDKYQQSMENWKKQIIIDPHLNSLFDSQLSADQFFHHKIMCLPHEDMVKVYMKLTSLKHSISKNMQKEIQAKHSSIEHSFQECLKSKSMYESVNQDDLRQNLKQIQKCNEKYEFIAERVVELKNIDKVLHFAKALEKFKVNIRLLKSLMKDFDQTSNSHLQIELLNTLKISKIIKEIAAITMKFDFSGIKSFEEGRIFINSTKGTIFGLIEKELVSLFGKIGTKKQNKQQELQKDVVNYFVVLNNINKLKDFCIPFFKNTLKDTSQLLKKSTSVGQLLDEKDLKKNLTAFWQFYSNEVNMKVIQNSTIFIAYDQCLRKTNGCPFNFSFFEKYWQNITNFMKDLINWCIQNESKEWKKQKTGQNLFESFRCVSEKRTLTKYLTTIIWKYPILFKIFTQVSNSVHLHIIKHTEFTAYDFSAMKEKLLLTLVPLAELYYRHLNNFFELQTAAIQRVSLEVSNESKSSKQKLTLFLQIFNENKATRKTYSSEEWLSILDWIVFSIQTQEINEYVIVKSLQISDKCFSVVKSLQQLRSEQEKQNLKQLSERVQNWVNRLKFVLTEKLIRENCLSEDTFSLNQFVSQSAEMVNLIKRFRAYKQVVQALKAAIV